MPQPTLPPVLIGPILRRVEPRSVSGFVATSAPAAIHLSIYDGVVDAANPPAEHVGADAQATAFGARFHATVVTANITGATPLLPGHRFPRFNLRRSIEGSRSSFSAFQRPTAVPAAFSSVVSCSAGSASRAAR
jgi:hypothetical protein